MTVDTERAAWLAGLKVGDEAAVYPELFGKDTLTIERVTPKMIYARRLQFDRETGQTIAGYSGPPTLYPANSPELDLAKYDFEQREKRLKIVSDIRRKIGLNLTDDQLQRITTIVNE